MSDIEIVDEIGEKLGSAVRVSRAERRRMMHDPLFHKKAIAGTEGVPVYDRLLAYGQILVYEMSEIQMRMSGLGSTPKRFRAEKQEQLTKEWNERVEKLEAVQNDIVEYEKNEKEKQEKTKSLILMPE